MMNGGEGGGARGIITRNEVTKNFFGMYCTAMYESISLSLPRPFSRARTPIEIRLNAHSLS